MRSRPVTEALTVRAVSVLAVSALSLSVVCGAVLAVVYRPHQVAGLRVLHAGGAAVALISAIAAAVVARTGRVGVSRRGALIVVALVLIVGAVITTGSSLAWTGGTSSNRGVVLSGADEVLVSGRAVSGDSVTFAFVIHVALAVAAVAVFAWVIVRQRRRGSGSGEPAQALASD